MDEPLRLLSVTVEDDLVYKMTFCVGGFELSYLPKYASISSFLFSARILKKFTVLKYFFTSSHFTPLLAQVLLSFGFTSSRGILGRAGG